MKIQSARATPVARAAAPRARNVTARAQAGAAVPDMNKRYIVNGMLVGATALPTAILAVPFIAFFVPPRCVRPTTQSCHACRQRSATMLAAWDLISVLVSPRLSLTLRPSRARDDRPQAQRGRREAVQLTKGS